MRAPTPLEKLTAAMVALGDPPCGNVMDPCQFWEQCAKHHHACHEYQVWANDGVFVEGGKYRHRFQTEVFTLRPRTPSRTTYDRVFRGK